MIIVAAPPQVTKLLRVPQPVPMTVSAFTAAFSVK